MTNGLTVGVLGGMGPDATVDFMARVQAFTDASDDQQHVRMIVDQNPGVPNRQNALLRGGPSPGPVLARMASSLESIGADFIVMPCNTAHAFASDIAAAISVPFISIVETTMDALSADADAGLLATAACVDVGIYQQAFGSRGIDFRLPMAQQVDELTRLAFRIKAGDRSAPVSRGVHAIAEDLVNQGASTLVVACTELPLVLDTADLPAPLVSSTDELARKTIRLARGDEALPTT